MREPERRRQIDTDRVAIRARGTGIAKRLLTTVFLRVYGSALARKRRGAPARACADTINYLTVHLSFLVTALLFGVVWIAFWVIERRSPQADEIDIWGVLIAIGAVVLINRWLKREFAPFAKQPELAEQYRQPWQRLVAAAAAIFFVFSWVGLYWLVVRLIRST
ncbi:MAG: hypothetical protein ACREYD_03345 [Casimicrobiaceae bacterium]